jgi:hypothetical protein
MATRPRPCLRCGAPIPIERLETIPETRICVTCSEEVGGEFIRRVRPVNTGKAGSLKKNYSDYELRLVRKRIEPKRD